MGTRADFYIGKGKDAQWLGSVAWDGYQWGEDKKCALMKAKTEKSFTEEVAKILGSREDATTPDQGWPWPWKNSRTTDCVYYFDNGRTRYETFSKRDWPDMSDRRAVTIGNRSGLLVFRG